MQYQDLDDRQKSLFITIMRDNSYKEIGDFCRKWLRNSGKYDATREGFKLFMNKHDIPCEYSVPTKTTLTLCAVKMLDIDAAEANEAIGEKANKVREGYVKICEQDNRDVIVHEDDLANYLEACYQISEEI